MPRNKGFSDMVNESDLVGTVCRDCDRRGENQLGFLKSAVEFQCHGCGQLVRPNQHDLLRAMNQTHPSPRPTVILDLIEQ
jgi:hypothetical protein